MNPMRVDAQTDRFSRCARSRVSRWLSGRFRRNPPQVLALGCNSGYASPG